MGEGQPVGEGSDGLSLSEAEREDFQTKSRGSGTSKIFLVRNGSERFGWSGKGAGERDHETTGPSLNSELLRDGAGVHLFSLIWLDSP